MHVGVFTVIVIMDVRFPPVVLDVIQLEFGRQAKTNGDTVPAARKIDDANIFLIIITHLNISSMLTAESDLPGFISFPGNALDTGVTFIGILNFVPEGCLPASNERTLFNATG